MGLGVGLGACNKRSAAPNLESTVVLSRGDRVVVEQTAARFFEGRVLAVEAGRLRVQAADGSDSSSVAPSDVYRLPPAVHELAPGALAICERGAGWLPCRLLDAEGAARKAATASGETFDVSAGHVLLPSPLTELNLKRYFSRSEAEGDFSRSAARAGEPRQEPGWRPSVHERLLARVGAEWFTGYVRELGDAGAVLSLSPTARVATVPFSALAAEPPSSFAGEIRRGDFVLVRPDTLSEPWARRLVRAASPTELKLADAAGTLKTVSPRDVLLLRP